MLWNNLHFDYILCIIHQNRKTMHCTEVRFASFLAVGFITAIIVNPAKRKLAKCTSVQCLGWKNSIFKYKKRYTFSTFSCRFLNPNYFFKIELFQFVISEKPVGTSWKVVTLLQKLFWPFTIWMIYFWAISTFSLEFHGVLLPRLFWPTVGNNCSSD